MERVEAMFRNTAMVMAASNGVKPAEIRKEWPLKSDKRESVTVTVDDDLKKKILTANNVPESEWHKYGL
jgi:hypothetical protein